MIRTILKTLFAIGINVLSTLCYGLYQTSGKAVLLLLLYSIGSFVIALALPVVVEVFRKKTHLSFYMVSIVLVNALWEWQWSVVSLHFVSLILAQLFFEYKRKK